MLEARIKIEVERLDEILGAVHALASALATLPAAPVMAPVAVEAQVEEPKPKRKAAKKAAPVVEEPAETEVAPAPKTGVNTGNPLISEESTPAAERLGQLESKPADPVGADTPVTVGKLASKPADPVEADAPVTLGELQGLCIKVAKAKGKETVMAIIQSMGASGLSKIPESKYAALRDAFNGAL